MITIPADSEKNDYDTLILWKGIVIIFLTVI